MKGRRERDTVRGMGEEGEARCVKWCDEDKLIWGWYYRGLGGRGGVTVKVISLCEYAVTISNVGC